MRFISACCDVVFGDFNYCEDCKYVFVLTPLTCNEGLYLSCSLAPASEYAKMQMHHMITSVLATQQLNGRLEICGTIRHAGNQLKSS